MTTLTLELAPVPAAAPQAAKTSAEVAPAWQVDPLLPTLLGMDASEIEVALLASGASYAQLNPLRTTVEQSVCLALAGLRRIGPDEVRAISNEWRRVNRRFLALPDSAERNRAWDAAVQDLPGGHLGGLRRQRAATDLAYGIRRSTVLREG